MLLTEKQKINIWMFIHDWNASLPFYRLQNTYKFDTADQVKEYAEKLRQDGHNLIERET